MMQNRTVTIKVTIMPMTTMIRIMDTVPWITAPQVMGFITVTTTTILTGGASLTAMFTTVRSGIQGWAFTFLQVINVGIRTGLPGVDTVIGLRVIGTAAGGPVGDMVWFMPVITTIIGGTTTGETAITNITAQAAMATTRRAMKPCGCSAITAITGTTTGHTTTVPTGAVIKDPTTVARWTVPATPATVAPTETVLATVAVR